MKEVITPFTYHLVSQYQVTMNREENLKWKESNKIILL